MEVILPDGAECQRGAEGRWEKRAEARSADLEDLGNVLRLMVGAMGSSHRVFNRRVT